MSEQGCTYREHEDEADCNKLCNPGHKMCPHHELLLQTRADKKDQRKKLLKAEAERAKVRNRRR